MAHFSIMWQGGPDKYIGNRGEPARLTVFIQLPPHGYITIIILSFRPITITVTGSDINSITITVTLRDIIDNG